MQNSTINHPYWAHTPAGCEGECWDNPALGFREKVDQAARVPGYHSANRGKSNLAWPFLVILNGITNSGQRFLTTRKEVVETPDRTRCAAFPHPLLSVHNNQPLPSLVEHSNENFFRAFLNRITALLYDPLQFPQASAALVQAYENDVISNEIPAYDESLTPLTFTEKSISALSAAGGDFMIKPNISAIMRFQTYYQQQYGAALQSLAKRTIEERLLGEYGLSINASNTWLHSFTLGESDENTVTGFAHNMKPAHSERLDHLVLKNFSGKEWENEYSMDMLNGVYNQSATEASAFGIHNEVRITPQQLMEEIWGIDIYQVYRSKLDIFWQKPRLQEMENLIIYIVNAARHFHNFQPEDREIFHQAWGLSEDKAGVVKRYLFDINGYPSTDIVILRRTNSPKVYVYDPRLENPFRVFGNELDMKSWFINRCADAAERQKIAAAFPAASRVQGYFKWGVDRYLQAMGDTTQDPNGYLDYVATAVKPLQGSLALLLAVAQKQRDYADLPYEITSHDDIRKARWASYLNVVNMILPNPATLIASWGMALDKMLNGVRWQERKQGAEAFFTDTAFLLLAALDGVVSRALDSDEEWLSATWEEEASLDEVIRAETEDLRQDYTQRLLAQKLGMEALPPELNVHNRPLRLYPAIEGRVKEMQITPAPVTFDELGPAEENGLFSGLSEGMKNRKYMQIKNQYYEVHYDNEAHEYYLGRKNGKRLPLFIDEENKVAFEKPVSAREIQHSRTLCRDRRAPGTSAGAGCVVRISEKSRQALDANMASALPAEAIKSKLALFDAIRALFKNVENNKLYFKYENHYFRVKNYNPKSYIVTLPLKINTGKGVLKLLRKSSILKLKLVPDGNSPSGITLAMKDEVGEIMLNLKRGGLPVLESYIKQEQTLSRDEISALTDYVNISSNAIREFCAKSKLVGPDVYSGRWVQQQAEHTLPLIRSGLKKSEAYVGQVYHGGSIKEALLNKLQPGDYISNAAFLSASEEKNIARLHQPEVNQLYSGTKRIILEIESNYRGHSVMKYSGKHYEKEVVFEDNTLFRVKSMDKANEVLVLVEVPVGQEVPPNKVIYYFDDWLLMEKDSGALHRYRPEKS